MKEISLTEGFVALVDDEDELLCRRYNWQADKRKTLIYAKRHVCFNGTKTTMRMHRLVTGIFDTRIHIDHIDGDGLNNQKSNLRVCTQAQNNRNKRPKSTNTSGFTGVNRQGKKWAARIFVNGKKQYLGQFDTKEEAARTYDAAAWTKFGEFARLNFPDSVTTTMPAVSDGLLETTNMPVIAASTGVVEWTNV